MRSPINVGKRPGGLFEDIIEIGVRPPRLPSVNDRSIGQRICAYARFDGSMKLSNRPNEGGGAAITQAAPPSPEVSYQQSQR